MKIVIRPEKKPDYPGIKRINDLAFGQESEGKLIEALRQTPSYLPQLSLVAEMENNLVGHILFYPLKIKSVEETTETLSLAPMAVTPEHQNKRIGTQLVEDGLERAKHLGYESVVVVGHRNYYPRFGFTRASKWGISIPFDVPDEAFMALELEPGSLKNARGEVEFPAAFYDAMR